MISKKILILTFFHSMLIIAKMEVKVEEMLPSEAPLRPPLVKSGCPTHCGVLEIPYPFGMSPNCYLDETFLVTCNDTFSPSRPFVGDTPVLNISLDAGELLVSNAVASYCFDGLGGESGTNQTFLETGMFTVSAKNSFTVIGCSTVSVMGGLFNGDGYVSGCAAFCSSYRYVKNGSCAGVGCCQMTIPSGLKSVNLTVDGSDITNGSDLHSCGYSFIVEETKFNFSTAYLPHFPHDTVPMVLDFAVGNETCQTVEKNTSKYACKAGNSICSDAENMQGYHCRCSEGFYGNPYLLNGCQDINECDDPKLNGCTHLCTNTEGSYQCFCPERHYGDGRKNGTGCVHRAVDKRFRTVEIILGVIVGFMVLLVSCSWLYIGFKRWKLMELKASFFERNGGLILEHQLSIKDESAHTAKLFTAEELEKATNNYADDRIVGKGGFGTVYKGTLPNGTTVAIKKSRIVDKTQNKQFINEVIILSQINHKNAVRLLGCCLEEEVPLLVYEFVSNSTLFDHIHRKTKSRPSIPWKTRLKIATETAGVLSYLHSSAIVPIIHRDVKSTNILLDDSYTAKISDFGASKLVPLDKHDISTIVQGTLGYLDPEYMQTSQLTEKSDVYSFGVVLVELITGRMPLCFKRLEDERHLSMYFLNALKEDRLQEILDSDIADNVDHEQLKEVSCLAKRCLRLKGDERPTMKEVTTELEGLYQMFFHHPWDPDKFSDVEREGFFS